MKCIRNLSAAVAMSAIAVVSPALAQNVGNNAGIWWSSVGGQPSAFTFLNPLTTMYGRLGFHWASYTGDTLNAVGASNPPSALNLPSTWGGTLALGARIMPAVRLELEISGNFNRRYRTGPPNGGFNYLEARFGTTQIMTNAYLDLAPIFGGLGPFNAYVMGGIGVGLSHVGDSCVGPAPVGPCAAPLLDRGNMHANFAWQAGAGAQYQVMRSLILDVCYAYVDPGFAQTRTGSPITRFDTAHHRVGFSIILPFQGLIRGFGN